MRTYDSFKFCIEKASNAQNIHGKISTCSIIKILLFQFQTTTS